MHLLGGKEVRLGHSLELIDACGSIVALDREKVEKVGEFLIPAQDENSFTIHFIICYCKHSFSAIRQIRDREGARQSNTNHTTRN